MTGWPLDQLVAELRAMHTLPTNEAADRLEAAAVTEAELLAEIKRYEDAEFDW